MLLDKSKIHLIREVAVLELVIQAFGMSGESE